MFKHYQFEFRQADDSNDWLLTQDNRLDSPDEIRISDDQLSSLRDMLDAILSDEGF